ncbi:MAG: Zn-dependent hydrolase [Acidobacteria bacterium]|nr:Zn-dependent hydrolase [Acidobacteriota bacterium]
MGERTLVISMLLLSAGAFAQPKQDSGGSPLKARSAQLRVVPDIERRLRRFRQVRMPFHAEGLTMRERSMVLKLVDAARLLDEIYWRQVDPDGLSLYESLAGSAAPQDLELRRYLWISGSRFDLLDGNRPFVGDTARPAGAGFYPQALTREEVEHYVKAHPEKWEQIYSPTTVIRSRGGDLEGLPYHVAYGSFLKPAAEDLRQAAELSPDPAFAHFLQMRAQALMTDDYFQSDIAWLELEKPRIDLIFAPYESYSDGLLGVKTTYGAAVLIRDEEDSRQLEVFESRVADIQDALPIPEQDRPSKHGLKTPMEVVDSPFRAGDLGHGYQAVADNLPNDPRVHEQKGTKKIFFKNFMEARVTYTILPLANVLMPERQAVRVSGDGYLAGTLLHEISHGLGPTFARTNLGGKTGIRDAVGPIFSALEEAKADVVGMFALRWLVDHGVLPQARLPEYYASYVAGNLRTMRFGAAEAHGRAETMEFNYYLEHGAIHRLPSGKYEVDYKKMPAQVAILAKELLEMEATGNRSRAEAWFRKYGVRSPQLERSLGRVRSVPVDVDPVFAFMPRAR